MATAFPAASNPPPPSVAATNMGPADIHGIKEPVPIPTGWEWLLWLLAVLALAFALRLLWKWWNKRRLAPKAKAMVPPHRRARERLRAALDLISNPYAFCSLVSDVLRDYLEERFEFHAPERTTEEFLNELWVSERLNPDHKKSLEQFLTECDLVKFAKHEPDERTLRQLLETAERFVDETAELSPAETAEKADSPGGSP
jgi:hypothetical protein